MKTPTKLFKPFILTACLFLFTLIQLKSQNSIGFDLSQMIMYDRGTDGTISGPLLPASRLGAIFSINPRKEFPKRSLLNRKFDVGIYLSGIEGVSDFGFGVVSDFAIEFPIGMGFDSGIRYENDTHFISSVKYIPGYRLISKEVSHAVQYDIGVSFLFKPRNKDRKDRRYDFVFFTINDLSISNYLGNSFQFRRFGFAFRSNIMARKKGE